MESRSGVETHRKASRGRSRLSSAPNARQVLDEFDPDLGQLNQAPMEILGRGILLGTG